MDNFKSLPNINYQKWLDKKIEEVKASGQIPKLLLHSCCGPCSSYVLEYLSPYFSITVFFYNPNIHPKEEYDKRLYEQKKLIKDLPVANKISLIEGLYQPDIFFKEIKGTEKEKEGGNRCFHCYRLRLAETARKAGELNFPYFTTTLSVSPHKNAQAINQIGHQTAVGCHLFYLYSDFKKKEGFKRSTVLSKKYRLYRQDYCGCVFSMKTQA